MTTEMSSCEYTYEVSLDWAKLPEGWSFFDVVDVAVDSHGDVYVGEVSYTSVGKHLDPPRELPCFRKLIRKK